MKSVGIKVLKNNLSKYLAMVRSGEVVYVTDRDDVIAEIRRPTAGAPNLSRWEAYLNEMERLGKITRGRPGKNLPQPMTLASGVDVQAILTAIREDRQLP